MLIQMFFAHSVHHQDFFLNNIYKTIKDLKNEKRV